MPIYRYICQNPECVNEYETLLLGSEKEIDVKCPKCNSSEKEKQIGGTSFQLKGSGWARDGYKRKR